MKTPIPDIDALPKSNRRSIRWVHIMLLFDAIGTMAAFLSVVVIGMESILATGPIFFVAGVIMYVTGRQARYAPAWILGLVKCAFCLLIFALIMIFNWGPRQAQTPATVIAAIYLFSAFPAAIMAYLRVPSPYAPWQCQTCGYPLIGLPSPRCPECATPFDPKQIPDMPQK